MDNGSSPGMQQEHPVPYAVDSESRTRAYQRKTVYSRPHMPYGCPSPRQEPTCARPVSSNHPRHQSSLQPKTASHALALWLVQPLDMFGFGLVNTRVASTPVLRFACFAHPSIASYFELTTIISRLRRIVTERNEKETSITGCCLAGYNRQHMSISHHKYIRSFDD